MNLKRNDSFQHVIKIRRSLELKISRGINKDQAVREVIENGEHPNLVVKVASQIPSLEMQKKYRWLNNILIGTVVFHLLCRLYFFAALIVTGLFQRQLSSLGGGFLTTVSFGAFGVILDCFMISQLWKHRAFAYLLSVIYFGISVSIATDMTLGPAPISTRDFVWIINSIVGLSLALVAYKKIFGKSHPR